MENKKTFKSLLSGSFSFFYLHRFLFAKMTIIFFTVLLFLGQLVRLDVWDEFFYYFFGVYYNLLIKAANVVTYFVFAIFFIAMFEAIQRKKAGQEARVWAVYKQAILKLPRFLYVLLAYVLKVFSWSLVLVVPGILFAIFYSGCFCSCCIDGKKGEEALFFSKSIIKKNFNTYCDYILFFVLLMVIIFIPSFHILNFAIRTFIEKKNIFGGVTVHLFQLGLLGYVINYCFVFYYFLYEEIKNRVESENQQQAQGSMPGGHDE
ncbi:hypothetical protein ACFL49_02355 [Candidatus Omnitrophota bacterium]